MNDAPAPEEQARQLMANAGRAYLGTLAERPGAVAGTTLFPFVSLVLTKRNPSPHGAGR